MLHARRSSQLCPPVRYHRPCARFCAHEFRYVSAIHLVWRACARIRMQHVCEHIPSGCSMQMYACVYGYSVYINIAFGVRECPYACMRACMDTCIHIPCARDVCMRACIGVCGRQNIASGTHLFAYACICVFMDTPIHIFIACVACV